MDSPALTFQIIAFRVAALLLIAGVQGFAIAGTAVLLGDKGPKYDGRMTSWPAGHIDLVGAAGLIVFGLGWTKPVAVDPGELRAGPAGLLACVLAGFAALLALAAILALLTLPALTMLPHTAALTGAAFLRAAANLSIWCALFSLVPIPPLAGGMLWQAAGLKVPPKAIWLLSALLLAAVATGTAQSLIRPVHAVVAAAILGR